MKPWILVLFVIFIVTCAAQATEFHSTPEGGAWFDPNTWVSQGIPDADDDVYIYGQVTVSGSNCNNLFLVGEGSKILPLTGAHAVLTVHGDLSCNGWIQNNNQYNLTLNLHGNLSISHEFRPHTFNWLGSGNRTLSCAANYKGIKTTFLTSISASIDTIFAASDIYFAPGGSATPTISGNEHRVVFKLYNDDSRSTYNLYSQSCMLDYLYILGNGSSSFEYNNDMGLNNVYMQYCTLDKLETTGIHRFYTGNSIGDIANSGMITNSGPSSVTLEVHGGLDNSGIIQSSGTYNLYLHAYGDIANTGTFAPRTLKFRGENPRTMSSDQDHPIQAAGNLTTDAGLGDIYIAGQLWFSSVPVLTGPISFRLYDQEDQPATLGFNSVSVSGASFHGVPGSVLYGDPVTLGSSSIEDIRLEGTMRFGSTCTASNIVNYASISNYPSGSIPVAIQGDFSNYGTISDAFGYRFTLNMDGDISNYGTWSAYRAYLNGDSAQSLSFGPDHPFTGLYLEAINSHPGLIVAENDLCFYSTQIDLNNSTLDLGTGSFALRLDNCQLVDTQLISNPNNLLYMTNASQLNSVGLQSITTSGVVILASEIQCSGNLVNNATIQNASSASQTLRVAGNLTNNGIIQNTGGYSLRLYVGGNLINNGEWKNNYTYLNGQTDQLIHFPEAHPYMGAYFQDTVADSAILTDCDLYFIGTSIDSNNSLWQLAAGNYSLYLDTCSLYDANFTSNSECVFSMINGGSITDSSFQSIKFQGTIFLASNLNIYGDLANYGTIQNTSSASRVMYVTGSVTNNGTLQNTGGFTFSIYAAANVTNLGVWSAGTLNLNGAVAQQVSFPAEHPFAGKTFTDSNSISPVYFISDFFSTNGAAVNANGANWYLSPGDHDMNLAGGTLSNAKLISELASTLTASDGCILSGCQFQSVTLAGHIVLQNSTTITGNLVNSSVLRNTDAAMSLYVNGHLTNHGQILNSSTGFSLYIYCGGDIINSGTMVNRYLYLNGSGETAQHISNSGTLSPQSITDNVSTSPVILDTDLSLNDCSIDLNNSILILNDGTRTGKTLNLEGGYLLDTSIVGGNGAQLVMGSSAYVYGISCDEIIWDGTILVYGTASIGHLQNLGTVMNYSGSSGTLEIQERLDNFGSISRNSTSSLFLNLAGNLFNHGTITNNYIDFSGTGEQTIFQAASASDIGCGSLRKTNVSGSLRLLSNLSLADCLLTLNNCSLDLDGYQLSLSGLYIQSTQLVSTGMSSLNLGNGAYLSGITAGNLTLLGNILIYGNCTFGTTINNGVLASRDGSTANLYINGNLTNYGTIRNGTNSLYMYLRGDLINHGNVNNNRMYVDGSVDQNLELSGTETLQNLTLRSGLGNTAWYRNGEFYMTTADLNLTMDFPAIYAAWQPYVAATDTWGRLITIHPPLIPDSPQNLSIQVVEGGVLLIWDEVVGATCYNIYCAPDPNAGFVPAVSGLVDDNPGDGTVQCLLTVSADKAFYLVKADNERF